LGFGSTASYDVTLNGKVLDLAVRESVEKLVAALDNGAWKAPAQ
jgi:curli biogenesis system outer membrane secretion channel CsgG